MISSAGSTKSTAARASATVTPGPRSGRASTNAISGSALGWRNMEMSAATPSGRNIRSVRCPKSGFQGHRMAELYALQFVAVED